MSYKSKFQKLLTVFVLSISSTILNGQGALPEICSARREAVMKETGGGALVIPGILRTPYGHNDVSSSKYFYYLTGWETPGAWIIIEPGEKVKSSLFITSADPSRQSWNNLEPGLLEAMEVFKADTAYPFNAFLKIAPAILEKYDTIWTVRTSKLIHETLSQVIPEGTNPVIMDARKILNDRRLVKDDYEISMLRKAITVTAEAQCQAMMLTAPGRWEYELEAAIEHTFRSRGCDGPGFTTIIGSGSNSTILHYDENSRQMKSGDLVVMDIGAENKGYKADITRTIPVSGKFTQEQLDIYNIVLEAQNEAIREMLPGGRSLGPHDRATAVIMRGLYKLGLVTDTTSQWQKNLYILYTCTHHIGLDIHDLYPYQLTEYDESVFRPGMVITIEPGIYLRGGMLNSLAASSASQTVKEEIDTFIRVVAPVFEKYKNTGVRIEDDILITVDGQEILSSGTPKEPVEIEKLMKRKSRYE